MAHDGIARTINPSHTPVDGDTIFTVATGRSARPANLILIGALAAEAVAQAVLRGVRAARGLPGFPSVSDLS
jgi:L-aminopeptidase/D-esterase-like protein